MANKAKAPIEFEEEEVELVKPKKPIKVIKKAEAAKEPESVAEPKSTPRPRAKKKAEAEIVPEPSEFSPTRVCDADDKSLEDTRAGRRIVTAREREASF